MNSWRDNKKWSSDFQHQPRQKAMWPEAMWPELQSRLPLASYSAHTARAPLAPFLAMCIPVSWCWKRLSGGESSSLTLESRSWFYSGSPASCLADFKRRTNRPEQISFLSAVGTAARASSAVGRTDSGVYVVQWLAHCSSHTNGCHP